MTTKATKLDKITCMICGEQIHAFKIHAKEAHPDMTVERYKDIYPDSPIYSQYALDVIKQQADLKKVTAESEKQQLDMAVGSASISSITSMSHVGVVKEELGKVFGIRKSKAVLSSSGNPIMIDLHHKSGDYVDMIPDIDENYIFPIDLLKNVLMGLAENIPIMLWGHAGVGKSTMYEQVAARTNRPYIRVQHTANTEESHIIGQILANKEGTYFEPGPLTLAMKHGLVYNADEYDFAHASILAVYQPVLEGKPLVIKEAPIEWRVIKPHKNFRFVATGNTNGSGDEHGLYAGTNMGNAANYSRFGITDHVKYMPKKQEAAIISAQSDIDIEDATKLVEFAGEIRRAFDANQMSATIGPRELIFAAKLGLRKNSWKRGVELAFINRLGTIDAEVADGLAQRIFDDKTRGASPTLEEEFEF